MSEWAAGEWLAILEWLWGYAVAAANVVLALFVSRHILLTKDEERAAISWLGLVWLAPFVGALLYFLFGINRIQRKAGRLRGSMQAPPNAARGRAARLPEGLGDGAQPLARFGMTVDPQPYVPGNAVTLLVNGDEAYPAMLAAIERAEQSVVLISYIFEPDAVGRAFVAALGDAVRRGVAVRVIVDDVGVGGLKLTRIEELLEEEGVPVATFLPTRLGRYFRFLNLRSHRKLLVVDGREAFVGGMNIHAGHRLADRPRWGTRDLHFRVVGPVIDQMNGVFEDDWEFCTGEPLRLPGWPPETPPAGTVHARALPTGPDDNFQKLRWILLGALASAQRRARILTPYFVPDEVVLHGVAMAAYRGVQVEVVVPEQTDVRLVDWAMRGNFRRLLQCGVSLFLSPPPFDHGKLFLVDDAWALVGSSNWDARSLRLNFELDLECVDAAFSAELIERFQEKRAASRRVTTADIRGVPPYIRLRDRMARLASPYL